MAARLSQASAEPLRVAVVGGSIGGLCAAVALRGAGCVVDIYERTAGRMASRGAGIVVQPDLLALLHRYGAPELPTIGCSRRRYLLADGGPGRETPLPQRFTSWEAIYQTLRAAFPDDRYQRGRPVSGFEQAGGDGVIAAFADGQVTAVDLMVCADGWRSSARQQLLPGVRPRYAGYIALRGTVEEARIAPDLAAFFDDRFTFSEARSGGHALCYLIPGAGAAPCASRRRLNWVWYVHAPLGLSRDELVALRAGEGDAGSVRPGDVPLSLVDEVKAMAERELHPGFAELVRATPDPFFQEIVDLAVPRMRFGRTCLVGDAAFVVRPHTAGATAKAAADALALGEAVATTARRGALDAALERWQRERLAAGRQMLGHGIALGERVVAVW